MPHDDTGLIKWAMGFLIATGTGMTGFFFNRLDKKVNKDSFEEYTEGHGKLHDNLDRDIEHIKDSLVNIEGILMQRREENRKDDGHK